MPGIGHGDIYKYAIRTHDGRSLEKSDPVAFYSELRPKTASIVYQLPDFAWQDGGWMRKRPETNWLEQPLSIYEVHLGSWKRPTDGRPYFNYRELAHMLVDYAH